MICVLNIILQEVIDILEQEMDRLGSLDLIGTHKKSGFYTRPRRFEVRNYVCVLS